MKKSKVLIQDSSNGFYKFLKLYFKDNFEIVNFNKIKDPKLIVFSEYDFAFFIISDYYDLVNLNWFKINFKNLFVGSYKHDIKEKLFIIEDIVIIDLLLKKKEIIDLIKNHTKLLYY